MSADTGTARKPKRFGEVKGPLGVALIVLGWFAAVAWFARSPGYALPQDFVLALPVLLANFAAAHGLVLLVLVVYVAWIERRRSARDIFAALGFRRQGIRRSLLWSLALFPAYAVVGLLSLMVASYTGPASGSGPVPAWFPYYLVVYSFFPVAVVEEAFGRGFLLDRLMPSHPARMVAALPAILLSSLLFTLWHLPSYLTAYAYSPIRTFLLLALNVFPLSVLLAIAYVRSRERNVVGPVFIHFLLDALPYLLFMVL